MITAADVRACRDTAGVLELFRRLGYPVAPTPLDSVEWRRAGIEVPQEAMLLMSRLPRFDVFLAEGDIPSMNIVHFLSAYGEYNLLTHSAFIYRNSKQNAIVVYAAAGNGVRHILIPCDEPTRHALDRLNLLALSDDADPSRLFARALDREAVARQFFVRFRAAVRDLGGALRASCPKEGIEALADEALLILSRLLFLFFVQEKGWLNGERRFLIDRAERASRDGADFFSATLLPLFFGCLNTPEGQRNGTARGLGRIPYLNGGLFEPSSFERRNPAMHAPNDLLSRILEDVFEKFDFTVDETESGGTRVDPEMLGKVFESLMADDERAASGSFYTPKEIVDELAGRAIAEWLSGGEKEYRDDLLAAISANAVSPRLRDAAEDLLRRLDAITFLDPACGSGAFLLSALHTIERLVVSLGGERRPDLRQRIVERNLYGVDLKPEAVRLCELRLWLAIVAGSDVAIENIRPLPNLDRNIMQGNSLLSPLDFLGDARSDIYREWSWGLHAQRDLVERYRHASRDERPALSRLLRANDRRLATDLLVRAIEADERDLQAELSPPRDLFGNSTDVDREAIRAVQRRIATMRETLERVENSEIGFFAFDVHFAPVMSRGGFDVVAGNPPWVRSARIEPGARQAYRERYSLFGANGNGTAFHQPDLSIAFVERSMSLASPGGIVSMLLPAKIANATYAAPLREFLLSDASVASIVDWTDERKRHFNADTFPLGLVVRKARGRTDVDVRASGVNFTVAADALPVNGRRSEWSLVAPQVARILRRLRERWPSLDEALGRRPVMGVKTGGNRNFFLDVQSVDAGWVKTRDELMIPTEFICRSVRGRDVRRWSATESQWMLWPPAGGWKSFPPWLQQLALNRRTEPEGLRLSYVRPEHVGIKVAWKDVSREMAATVLPDTVEIAGHSFPLVPNQTLYSVDAVSLDEAYAIAGLLNSVVVDALLFETAERAKDDHYRYFGRSVERIPFPVPQTESANWHRLVRSSRVAHHERRSPEDHDALIAELYGIAPHELEVLRAHVARRVAAR